MHRTDAGATVALAEVPAAGGAPCSVHAVAAEARVAPEMPIAGGAPSSAPAVATGADRDLKNSKMRAEIIFL